MKMSFSKCSSLNSFAEIVDHFSLENRLLSPDLLAHLHHGQAPEILAEHITKVNNYALGIIAVHNIDNVVDGLLQQLGSRLQLDSKAQNYIKKLFFSTIVYHDYGKINENFQKEKMKNETFLRVNNSISTQHSILSALLFLENAFKKIMLDFDGDTRVYLTVIALVLSSSIRKHHSPFLQKSWQFDVKQLRGMSRYMKNKDDVLQKILDVKRQKRFFERFYQKMQCEDQFIMYALLKLNFSILTTSDFYATSDYAEQITIKDFGVFNSERKASLHKIFWKYKYNKNINKDCLQQSLPKEVSRCNLNILRRRMLLEALQNARKNAKENIFFLEAPTGSGKTNLSLGVALEWLNNDDHLNKVFYVFPFTALATQTFSSIKTTLALSNVEIIQSHSRSCFHLKEEQEQDGLYAEDLVLNYLNNSFLHYPITLLTHVTFFDILKSNSKQANYLLHRLAHSVVVIDELQSYPPQEWDKICFFLNQYARYFHIKFLLMSATLPKLDTITSACQEQHFVSLLDNKNIYFHNPNFCSRVRFDFSLLDMKLDLENLVIKIHEICKEKLIKCSKIKVLVEFITKNTAARFLQKAIPVFEDYEILLLSGTILEPRRKEIINKIKNSVNQKLLVVCTQVIEAGVDIDMDIGFKDTSILDSEEQFAGRINREATKKNATVYLFDIDHASCVYKGDIRLEIMKSMPISDKKQILNNKDFDAMYKHVCTKLDQSNNNEFMKNLDIYKERLKKLDMHDVDRDFLIIDQSNQSVFVPLLISSKHFIENRAFLQQIGIWHNDYICGEKVWQAYREIITNNESSFINKKIQKKQIYAIMSQFTFSVYGKQQQQLLSFCDAEKSALGFMYLSHYQDVYDYKNGINVERFDETEFL